MNEYYYYHDNMSGYNIYIKGNDIRFIKSIYNSFLFSGIGVAGIHKYKFNWLKIPLNNTCEIGMNKNNVMSIKQINESNIPEKILKMLNGEWLLYLNHKTPPNNWGKREDYTYLIKPEIVLESNE